MIGNRRLRNIPEVKIIACSELFVFLKGIIDLKVSIAALFAMTNNTDALLLLPVAYQPSHLFSEHLLTIDFL